jgi:hypothetical protein
LFLAWAGPRQAALGFASWGDFYFTSLRLAMSSALIEMANLAANLTPRPIESSWIIEGNPAAQSAVL